MGDLGTCNNPQLFPLVGCFFFVERFLGAYEFQNDIGCDPGRKLMYIIP